VRPSQTDIVAIDEASPSAFLEHIRNRGERLLPLYAARIEDLGQSDFLKVDYAPAGVADEREMTGREARGGLSLCPIVSCLSTRVPREGSGLGILWLYHPPAPRTAASAPHAVLEVEHLVRCVETEPRQECPG
jgi:hypothetical protein